MTDQIPLINPLPLWLQLRGFRVVRVTSTQNQGHDDVEYVKAPMVKIPAGTFLMGNNQQQENQQWNSDLPQQVKTLKTFDIAVYPLTVAEYACFVRSTQRSMPQSWQYQQQQLQYPIVDISWYDAVAYAHWLTTVTGQTMSIPSEAEWEKAARGSDGRKYPWGSQWREANANTSKGGFGGTSPVGSYPNGASPFGVMDMAGNILEWTKSLFWPYPYVQEDGREAPYGKGSRVLRGGAWDFSRKFARTSFRTSSDPSSTANDVGTRLVRYYDVYADIVT